MGAGLLEALVVEVVATRELVWEAVCRGLTGLRNSASVLACKPVHPDVCHPRSWWPRRPASPSPAGGGLRTRCSGRLRAPGDDDDGVGGAAASRVGELIAEK